MDSVQLKRKIAKLASKEGQDTITKRLEKAGIAHSTAGMLANGTYKSEPKDRVSKAIMKVLGAWLSGSYLSFLALKP